MKWFFRLANTWTFDNVFYTLQHLKLTNRADSEPRSAGVTWVASLDGRERGKTLKEKPEGGGRTRVAVDGRRTKKEKTHLTCFLVVEIGTLLMILLGTLCLSTVGFNLMDSSHFSQPP